MTARNWWLRSPNPSNCNNVRNCTDSGTLNNNNANNTYGELDDCVEGQFKYVPEGIGKPCARTQGAVTRALCRNHAADGHL